MSSQTPTFIQSKLEIHLWWVTAILIAVNVGLFSWQVIQGMDVSTPAIEDALAWGADYAPLTYLNEPYRLFSSMFFHFGLIHLMLNMWALYIFGSIAEQLYGRFYFLALYILAGLTGSLLSGYVSIQDSFELLSTGQFDASLLPSVGAGASGAVMGLGASLTLLSLLPVLPTQLFILDKKTLVTVLALNLVMGFMISGINNAAHIGGMIMGVLLTAIWYFGQSIRKSRLICAIGIIIGVAICYYFYDYNMQQVAELKPFWQILVERIQAR